MHARFYSAVALVAAVFASGCLTNSEVWDKVDNVPEGDDIRFTKINPNSGPRSGGTRVEISASPLDHQPVVTFDGNKADIIDWGSNGVIVTTPSVTDAGAVDVEIWSGARYGVAHTAYEFTND